MNMPSIEINHAVESVQFEILLSVGKDIATMDYDVRVENRMHVR